MRNTDMTTGGRTMENVTISIDTMNSAFKGSLGMFELGITFREVAEKLMRGERPRIITDVNGNTVGTVEYR